MIGLNGQDDDRWNKFVNILNTNYMFLKEEDDYLVSSQSPSGKLTTSFGYKSMFLNEEIGAERWWKPLWKFN